MDLLAHQLRLSALQDEATRFQRFARDAPIGILFLSTDGAVQFANHEYLRITGRTREEFEADRFRLEPGRVPEFLRPELGPRHESEYLRDDGTTIPILVGLSTQPDGIAAFVLDLTAEKAAQRARQESEERFRAIAEKLAEADRRKDEFFSALSHELRNPLACIRNALHLLAHEPSDPVRAARARTVMERQMGHLSRLVDDLLDVTRIARGRIHLRRARLDLARLVHDTVEDHRTALEAAGLELALQLPPARIPVEGDATRLAQVLGNLLANAAKFTPRGGRVAVRLAEKPRGTALLEVRDTGEGIEPDVLARIFEPFAQADHSLARSRGGLGLGLTLVKGLVELHGGTVTVRSSGPGAGTDVTVRLPVVRAAYERSRPAPPAAQLARQPTGVGQVLVVEDNADAAETLRDALELEGMSVTVASDGRAGVTAARRLRPAVVICDIGLPGDLDGYGVARAIRTDPELGGTRLIALTGYAGPEDQARAREAGFDRHLAKPSGIEELLRTVDELVQR